MHELKRHRRVLSWIAALAATAALAAGWPAAAGAQEPEPQPPPEPESESGFQTFIVGGEPAGPGETPWMVALLDAYQGYQFCGATLVAPSWVLTAGHCVTYPAPAEIDALLGRQDLSASGGERIRVAESIRHPDYYTVDTIPVNDVAVLRLTDPSTQASLPVVPPGFEQAWEPGTDATAYGWGSRSGDGTDYPDELHKVVLPIQADSSCRSAHGTSFQASSMLCAGPLETGGRDTCEGDSGGPLVVPFWWGVAQVGVTSWGWQPCASPGQPGVFAEVPRYAPWITHLTEYGPLGQQKFIHQSFVDYLGRPPTTDERNFWLWVLTGDAAPGALIANLNQSHGWQYTAGSVARLYRAAFQRDADVGGLEHWIGELRRGRPLINVADYFASSPEFMDKYGSLDNGQFVDRAYQNVFGRAADPGGRAYWIDRLESGLSRGGLLIGFSDSQEFRDRNSGSIDRMILFFGSIRRLPNDPERQFLAAQSLEAIANGIPNNVEYNRRF